MRVGSNKALVEMIVVGADGIYGRATGGGSIKMQRRHGGIRGWTPRAASSVCPWTAPWRDDDWVASRFGHG